MIETKDFLDNCPYKEEMRKLIETSNLALKNWEIYWSDFYSYYIYSNIIQKFNQLSDIEYFIYGGYESCDRAKIAFYRNSIKPDEEELKIKFPGEGIDISGNFLFENASQSDFRNLLQEIGIKKENIGDIWTLGDRGAQGVISNSENIFINNKNYSLRDVEVHIKIINLKELKTPIKRIEKYINTVEASTRLDAIASAGFRLSRSKISNRIKNGLLSLNGCKTTKPTLALKKGDKLQLENKGFIEILEIEKTKRDRWKIKLLRK